MKLSCADMRWNELILIISKLNGLALSEDKTSEMHYHERCYILNSNPLHVRSHFQYRVEMFLRQMYLMNL